MTQSETRRNEIIISWDYQDVRIISPLDSHDLEVESEVTPIELIQYEEGPRTRRPFRLYTRNGSLGRSRAPRLILL